MTTYTKEEQIAQAMEWMRVVKESGKTCGLMEDLQQYGWREEFNKVLEVVKKEEERIECHDCGELSECFEERQGVSMGGIVYDYSIGKCCEENYLPEEEDKKYIVRFERAVYGDEHGDIMYMDTVDETEYDTLHEAREAYDSYEVQDTGELLYLDMISGEDEEHENVDMRGTID